MVHNSFMYVVSIDSLYRTFQTFCNTICSNIKRTRTSFFKHWTNSMDYRTQTSNFGFERTDIEYWTYRAFTKYTKLLIEQTGTSFFEHRTDSNVFIFWLLNSNILFLSWNDRTLNFEYGSTHHYFLISYLTKPSQNDIFRHFGFSPPHLRMESSQPV